MTDPEDLLCRRELRLPDLRVRGGESSTSVHSKDDLLPSSLLSRLTPEPARLLADTGFLDAFATSSDGLEIVNLGRGFDEALSGISG
jgi:hypothetical protein